MYVDQCDISGNTADRGAALYLYDLDDLKVSQTIFRNNSGVYNMLFRIYYRMLLTYLSYTFVCSIERRRGMVPLRCSISI